MQWFDAYLYPLIGGVLIGVFSVLLKLLLGRSAAMSNILNHVLKDDTPDNVWRVNFILGLMIGGGLYQWQMGVLVNPRDGFPLTLAVISGLLMGFGARIAHSSTSGHGICLIPLFNKRAIVSTVIFFVVAVCTVYLFRYLL